MLVQPTKRDPGVAHRARVTQPCQESSPEQCGFCSRGAAVPGQGKGHPGPAQRGWLHQEVHLVGRARVPQVIDIVA
jgi:hypothetical protein